MQSLGDHILEYDPSQLLIVFVVLVSLSTTAYIFMRYDDGEQPVPFQVPIPEQSKPGWQGEILEHPSIKVRRRSIFLIRHAEFYSQVPGSSAIQCYCPANGTLLGRVNPATPDGIDRAIIRAREAQRSWAKTTFSQRRRVLKTMLKYAILTNFMAPRINLNFLQLYTGQSGSHCTHFMFRFWQNENRRIPW